MNHSENMAELAAALSKAQGEMQAAIKGSENPFFKSKYADLGSVWDAARPVLSKNGLCVMQTTELQGELVILVTALVHISGQWVKSYLPLKPAKNDSQGMGAAITYLRRYSLSALVGVVCDDDDDGETAVGRGKTPPSLPNKQSVPPLKKENKLDLPKIDTNSGQFQPDTNMEQQDEKISSKELNHLIEQYFKTTDEFKTNCEKFLANDWKINDFSKLTKSQGEKIMKWVALNLQAQEKGEIK